MWSHHETQKSQGQVGWGWWEVSLPWGLIPTHRRENGKKSPHPAVFWEQAEQWKPLLFIWTARLKLPVTLQFSVGSQHPSFSLSAPLCTQNSSHSIPLAPNPSSQGNAKTAQGMVWFLPQPLNPVPRGHIHRVFNHFQGW